MFQKERNKGEIHQLHQKEVVERGVLRLLQNMITKKIIRADILQNEMIKGDILSKERAAEDHDRQTEGPRHLTGQIRQVSKCQLSSFQKPGLRAGELYYLVFSSSTLSDGKVPVKYLDS